MIFFTIISLLLLSSLCAFGGDFPFRNVSLPWNVRVDDLVSRLTLDEIVLQLASGGSSPGGGSAPAIPKLKINPWKWNTECLHGVKEGIATTFPQSLGLAATFNTEMMRLVGEAISIEDRAKYTYNTKHGIYGSHLGLNCFSPVVNVMRHPLWGRNQETYGEDPYLSGQFGRHFVRGLQGDHPRYIRASATCKHFDVYGGPDNYPQSRITFSANVTNRDWRLTFLPAFYGCVVEGGARGVMCSYNEINGIPACAHKGILTGILRNEWNFTGFVVSDQGALLHIVDSQKWKKTYDQAAGAALSAGVNLELSVSEPYVYTYLPLAIKNKLVEEKDLIEAVKPLFLTRMRLGEFDPPEMNPYAHYPMDVVQSKAHKRLATKAAAQSFVLLRNQKDLLPLKKKFNTISVVGPMADTGDRLDGDYAPPYNPNVTITPLKGIAPLAKNVRYAQGCDNVICNSYDRSAIINAIDKTDLIVVCLGTGIDIESESIDRHNLSLPGHQDDLLRDVLQNHGSVPVILILFNAGPVASNQFANVDAILECFFPGQQTGVALYKILTGEENPAARLPFTWPSSLDQVPEITNYSMVNRTYRYWDNSMTPLYPFGYGLSYTQFAYDKLKLDKTVIKVGEDVHFSVIISNVGGHHGDEVIQAYISWVNPREPMPNLQLVAFDRVRIRSGSRVEWRGKILAEQMAVYFDDAGFRVVPGDFHLYVGGQQPNQKVTVESNVLKADFTLRE